MGSVIYDTAATLNGFLTDEHGSLAWLFSVPGAEGAAEQLIPLDASVLVEGASTYLWMLEAENLLAEPAKWQQFYGSKPLFVFTHRTLAAPAGADVRFVAGSVAEVIGDIRAAAGEGDIWIVGGGELAGQFIDAGEVDEVAVSIAPATAPSGAPLLPRSLDSSHLELVSATAVGQFARLRYSVRRA